MSAPSELTLDLRKGLTLVGPVGGMGRGTKWLWWTMLWSGLPAYACAIGVHFIIGYLDFIHLLPAYLGLGIFLIGLFSSRAWMWNTESKMQ